MLKLCIKNIKAKDIDNDSLCYFCNEKEINELSYPCRICTRVFHVKCYEQKGYIRNHYEKKLMLQGFNNIGWSCYNCVKLNEFQNFFLKVNPILFFTKGRCG